VEFRPARRIGGKGHAPHQFERTLRGIAIGGAGRIYAVGDSAVKVFGAEGDLLRQWATRLPGESVAVDAEGRVWVGQQGQVEIHDARGDLADTWRDAGRLGLVTAIGFGRGDVFLADATARWIHRYDRNGGFLNNIGTRTRGGFTSPMSSTSPSTGPRSTRIRGCTNELLADGTLLGHFGRFDGCDRGLRML
jgi:hypothetical protein